MAAWSACQVLPAQPPDQQQVRRRCSCMMSVWNGMWRADTSRTLSVQTAYGPSWLAYLHPGSPVCAELNPQCRDVSPVEVVPGNWAGSSACSVAALHILLSVPQADIPPASKLKRFVGAMGSRCKYSLQHCHHALHSHFFFACLRLSEHVHTMLHLFAGSYRLYRGAIVCPVHISHPQSTFTLSGAWLPHDWLQKHRKRRVSPGFGIVQHRQAR